MKKLTITFIAVLFALSLANNVTAQNNVWQPVGNSSNVWVSWRYRQELKNQYVSEFGFENKNNYKVEVSVQLSFICHNGTEEKAGSFLFTIKPLGKHSGQWAGLFWYPCGGATPPAGGRYRDLIVKTMNSNDSAMSTNDP